MPAAPPLHIDIVESDQNAIVRLKGEVGVSNADELDRRLLALTAKRPPLVVFDLQELKFISSLGLGILLRFQQGLERHKCKVRFAAAQEGVRSLLRACLLDTVLRQYD